MKIMGVRFKNINALQGTWEVRFDQPPLADTRLFAIVGPNGSGKTSILDALTLALYGETPRMRDPDRGMLSPQAEESFSEVDFSVGESLYRSRWSARRSNGGLESPEMMLAHLNGQETILEDKVIKVRAAVAELTGLDFKRFCRTVLLAQGEFTAFLNALESERSEIMERIIGPELTRELEQQIFTMTRAEQENLLELKESAASLPLVDRARIEALRETVEQTEEALAETERLFQDLRAQEEWLKRVDFLESEFENASEDLAEAEARSARLKTQMDRLEEARKALPYKEEVLRVTELQQEADAAVAALKNVEAEIELNQKRTGELENQLSENRQALDQTRARLKDLEDDTQRALQVDREISEENGRFLELVSLYETLERTLKEKQQQQSDLEVRIPASQRLQQELQGWLREHAAHDRLGDELPLIEATLANIKDGARQMVDLGIRKTESQEAEQRAREVVERAMRSLSKVDKQVEKIAGRKNARDIRVSQLLETETVESLLAHRREQENRLEALKKLVKTAKKYHKLTHGEDLQAVLTETVSRQNSLGQSLALEKARLAELEKADGWHEAVREYAPGRSLLQSGKPCPLCGALDHPFLEEGPPDVEDQVRMLRDQRAKVNGLQEEINVHGVKAGELQPRIRALEPVHEAWARACSIAGGEWSITGPDSVLREALRSTRARIKRFKSRIRSVRWLKWRTGWTARALQRKSEKLARRELEAGRLKDAHELHVAALADIETNIEKLRQEEERAREELRIRSAEMSEPLPEPGFETRLIGRLRQRWTVYLRRKQEYEAVAEQLQAFEAQREALPGELDEIRERTGSLGVEIEACQQKLAALKSGREEAFAAMDPIRESRDLESEIELRTNNHHSLEEELDSAREAISTRIHILPGAVERSQNAQAAVAEAGQRLPKQATLNGFDSIDRLRDSLKMLEEEGPITEQWTAAQDAGTERRSRFEAARAALDSARSEREAMGPMDAVRRSISEAVKRRDQLREELEEGRRTLQEERRMEEEYKQAMEAVAKQEKVFARASAEEDALRSRDPAEIRNKRQRLMLERLLQEANRFLERLNGRYSLRPVSDEGLGFHVEDFLRDGTFRSVKTLSGGESFVVSLCLALGLTEMAGRDRKIESLFLDEGFGALDDEMLYKVMTTLKELQENGKTVGIISHVKRLADEIPTQIRVEKQPDGRSQISIVA